MSYMSNYFELLSIEKKYDIDMDILTTQYLAMQSKYHPDMIKTMTGKQSNLAISIDLNTAYQILKDDFKRAEYLLLLNNIILDDAHVRQKISKDQLNDIWGDLELVENTSELVTLEHILESKTFEQKTVISALTSAFKSQDMQLALGLTIKLKYLGNLINNIQLKINSFKYASMI